MTNIIDFTTRAGISSDSEKLEVSQILDSAKDLEQVVVVGITKENELYVSSSDNAMVSHWMLTLASHFLIDIHNEEA